MPKKRKSKRKSISSKIKHVGNLVEQIPLLPPHVKTTKEKLWKLLFERKFIAILLPIIFIIGSFYYFIFRDFPSPTRLTTNEIPQTTKILDRNGNLLFDIYVDKNRTLVPLSDIPMHMQQAIISIEDKEFYQHRGLSPVGGMIRALRVFVLKKQIQGGSTITQQLIKTALLSPERTLPRKIKEIILAPLVELRYSKSQILEMYLNQVPFGGTAWGIEAASQLYFGKSIKYVSIAEAALLAGLPQAPTLYSPYGANPEFSKNRQKAVLSRMVEDGYLTQEQADQAYAEELDFQTPNISIKAAHFVMYVKKQLVEKYGEKQVEQGGLKVTTTLDLPVQEFAELVVASEVAKLTQYKAGNGASLVTRPYTGEILAMIGSKDYFASDSGNFNVVTASRQPGSSIKPINYAIGIENKVVTPATVFIDEPTCFSSNPTVYCPKNYDGSFHGPVQLRFALGNSYNIPAVKMLRLNSVDTMIASASAFGITTLNDPNRFGLSLTLGGGEVPMTEMVTAFGVFANSGIRKDLVSILKVEDSFGKVLEEYQDANLNKDNPSSLLIEGPRAISQETAFLISHILLDQNARSSAFGTSFLQVAGHPAVSVKTGTTDDLRDNWTIGFTPDVVIATWVGNNDNTPMNPQLTSGITGAAPIWNKIMAFYLQNKKENWPKQPEGIIGLQVCPISGLLPQDDNSCGPRFEYFRRGTEPKEKEQLKTHVQVNKTTNKLAKPEETENIETQEKLITRDMFGQYCIDCSHDGDQSKFIR